jgi:threonine aldolase
LTKTNMVQTPGYGMDEFCASAAEKIKKECAAPQAGVHFLMGGTQTNTTVIAASLRPHQGVISAVTGHVNTHEDGAIEESGHKVLALPSRDGKLTASQVADYMDAYWGDENHEHIVQPAMLYISQPTENGTVYSLPELEMISAVCREKNLLLFVDGARLGAALVCQGNMPALADLARLSDVFYIGGTKMGALFGEAVVITNENIEKDFRCIMKQRGRHTGEGQTSGRTVRHAVYRRTLLQGRALRRGTGHASEEGRGEEGLGALLRFSHKPAVSRRPGRRAGKAFREVQLCHLGAPGGRQDGRTLLHQLGHPPGGYGRAYTGYRGNVIKMQGR